MKIEDIKPGEVFGIIAPNIQATISGAYKAGFYPDGRITLKYVDESEETVKMTIPEAQAVLDAGLENWFSLVSSVQAQRTFSKVCRMMQGEGA